MNQTPTIAICYDFDGTLIQGNMQENSFIPSIGMQQEDFWDEVKKNSKKHDMDEVLSYMQMMINKAREKDIEFNRRSLQEHGNKVKFFDGVTTWFDAINSFNTKCTIEHYIISSGLEEMIRGSKIGTCFKHIFASGFVYDANNVAIFPARSINYTTKVQYLFRINKGIYNSWDNKKINKFIEEEKRIIPFTRMIYIGDGETDVPAMKMMNYKGGYTIAVYPPPHLPNSEDKKKIAETLRSNNRCQFVEAADYTTKGRLFQLVTTLITRIYDEFEFGMNLKAR